MANANINLLDLFAELSESSSITEKDRDELYRLREMIVRSVHLVDRGANKRRFAVVKRSDDMPFADDLSLGPEIVENADGSLSVLEKQLSMPGPAKAGMTRILTEAMERGASLLAMLKAAKEDADAKVPTEPITEALAIGKLYASVGERYPSPQSKADEEDDKMTTEKVQHEDDEEEKKAKKAAEEAQKAAKQEEDEEEDEEKKAKKATDDEDEMKKLEDGSIGIGDEIFTGALAEFAMAFDTNVQKAGRKISGGRLKRLKDLLVGMKKLVSELDPSDFNLKDFSAALSKRMDDQRTESEGLRAEVASLKEMLGKAVQSETIGAGVAGDASTLAKGDKKDEGWLYNTDLCPAEDTQSGDSPRASRR